MRSSHVGLVVGAILGLTLVLEGFAEMLVVALGAAIGWVVARAVEGDIDLVEIISHNARRRSRS